MKRLIYILGSLCAGLLLCECSAVKECKDPELNIPQQMFASETDSLTIADIGWWEFYGDEILRDIIERVLSNNKRILAAAARVERARQFYRVARGAQFPNFYFEAPFNNETNDYYGEKFILDPELGLKFTLKWELDLWGNLRWAKRRSNEEYIATAEDERAMRMLLVAEAATAYFRLVALDNELSIVRNTLVTRSEGVELARIRFEGGLTSDLPYQQAQVEHASVAALIPNLERDIEATENALSLLMGETPDWTVLRAKKLQDDEMPEKFAIGIPSVLLQRRPDMRAAEHRLRSAMASVGVAYADRFPRIAITLTGGVENNDFVGIFRSPFSYVAGTLLAPIFNFGVKKSRYKAAIAAYDEARLNYEQKVLEVFHEVEAAVVGFRSARSAAELKLELREAASQYVDLARWQYRSGSINYLDLLDAQRRYLDAQIGWSNAVRDEHLALVRLYKALGGGWQVQRQDDAAQEQREKSIRPTRKQKRS